MSRMNYKRCDRCGKETAHAKENQGYETTGWSMDTQFPFARGHVSRMELWELVKQLDLCPDCTSSYWNWWNAKREKP